jgi:hypothetical protein
MSEPATVSREEIAQAFMASIESQQRFEQPYRHHLVSQILPPKVCQQLTELPFEAPSLEGESGRREIHNDTRSYFDAEQMARYPVMRAVADVLQSKPIAQAIHRIFDAPIDDTFLRLEYALDQDGFWLEPHTDLGVKKFTCLIYLSEGHEDLGTDIYWDQKRHYGVSPFIPNSAMIFVPSDKTWHGFEKRPIKGVRKSVILNYVTHDWRAREQLSFPQAPVRI